MARNYAVLPHNYLREMGCLSDAEFGRLCRALLAYSMNGTTVALNGNERFYSERVMMHEDESKAEEEAREELRVNAAKVAARARWNGVRTDANECDRMRSHKSHSEKCERMQTHSEEEEREKREEKEDEKEKSTKREKEEENRRENKSKEEEAYICPERCSGPQDDDETVYRMVLNDGSEFEVKRSYMDMLKGLYPAVDVEAEIRKMIGWLDANPSRRKTRVGVKRFVNGWLAKQQDRSSGWRSSGGDRETSGNIFAEIARDMGVMT